MNNFNCDDILQTLDAGATLLDARTTDELKASCLPDARNIPLAILPLLAHEYMENHEPVLIYCHFGGRAVIAESIVTDPGFTDVTSIGSLHNFQHYH